MHPGIAGWHPGTHNTPATRRSRRARGGHSETPVPNTASGTHPHITAPTLVAHGSDDTFNPVENALC